MNLVVYILFSIFAIVFGQLVGHLSKKMPAVVSEEITYNEFFKSFKEGFKIDIKYSLILLIIYNCLLYFVGNTLDTYLYALMMIPLLVTFSVDFNYKLIPDETHIFIGILGLIHFVFNIHMWYSYLIGAAIGAGVFIGLNLLGMLIFKKTGMGYGDVKLMGALGFFFGIKNILVITLVSFVLGAIIGGAMLILKKDDDGYIAFGPFIVASVIVLMFVNADYIIDIYIQFCSWLGMRMSDAVYFFIK